jgi:hypothetical protein
MIETPGFCHSLIRPQKNPPLVPQSASWAQENEVGEDAIIWRYQSKDLPCVVSRNVKGELGRVDPLFQRPVHFVFHPCSLLNQFIQFPTHLHSRRPFAHF